LNDDGNPIGFVTEWYENGQKMWEMTYKNGNTDIIGMWNEDGSVY